MRIGRGDPNKTRNKGIYEDPRLNSSPTNSEDYGMSDGDDYGLKVCVYPFVRNGS